MSGGSGRDGDIQLLKQVEVSYLAGDVVSFRTSYISCPVPLERLRSSETEPIVRFLSIARCLFCEVSTEAGPHRFIFIFVICTFTENTFHLHGFSFLAFRGASTSSSMSNDRVKWARYLPLILNIGRVKWVGLMSIAS